jgi:transposase
MGLRCKACGSEEHVKNGFMRGKQRYRCKACGLNFTDTPPPGKPLAVKAMAVLLYVSGLSMNRTAKLLGVSTPSVQAWIEQFAQAYGQKPEPEGRALVIELDEMWHYVKNPRGPRFRLWPEKRVGLCSAAEGSDRRLFWWQLTPKKNMVHGLLRA